LDIAVSNLADTTTTYREYLIPIDTAKEATINIMGVAPLRVNGLKTISSIDKTVAADPRKAAMMEIGRLNGKLRYLVRMTVRYAPTVTNSP
jgi:hypothetical protein